MSSGGNSSSPPRGDPRSSSGQRSVSGGTGRGNNNNGGNEGDSDSSDRDHQRPVMPPYMPFLLTIAAAVTQSIDERVLYTVMDLLAAHYALHANESMHAVNLWNTILALTPDGYLNQGINGFSAYENAVQNGGIVGHIPATTNAQELDRDAAIHLSWAWRRLNLLHQDEDRDEIERLGVQIWGPTRWAEETAARAQSPSAE